MRAVTGSAVSSKSISLSKASAVLSRFAANENPARLEVAAYVRRASAAFDELVRFHRELPAARKLSELEMPFADEGNKKEDRRKQRKRSRDESEVDDDGTARVGADGEIGEVVNLVDEDGNRGGGGAETGSDGERNKKKRTKKADAERSNLEEKNLVSDRNLVEYAGHYGNGAVSWEDGKSKKKKKVDEEEISLLGRKGELKPEVVEERHQHKKKKKEKHNGDQKEEILAEVLDRKHRKNLDVGEGLGELKDQNEQHKKKKKKNRTED